MRPLRAGRKKQPVRIADLRRARVAQREPHCERAAQRVADHDRARRDQRVEVGRELRRDDLAVALEPVAHTVPVGRRSAEPVQADDLHRHRLGQRDERCAVLEAREELRGQPRAVERRVAGHRRLTDLPRVERELQRGREQPRLVAEVVVHERWVDLGRAGDRTDGGLRVAGGDELAAGGGEDGGALGRLAAWCFDHRRRVVTLWIAVLVAVVALSRIAGGSLSDSFSSSGSPSGRAQALLAARFPAQAGDVAQVVFHPADAARIARASRALAPLAHVSAVSAPRYSRDRSVAYVTVQFNERAEDLPDAAVQRVIDVGRRDGAQLGGPPIAAVANVSPGSSEAFGILAAIVIMLLAFGSVVAMGLPILVALLGVGIGFGLVSLLSRLITV